MIAKSRSIKSRSRRSLRPMAETKSRNCRLQSKTRGSCTIQWIWKLKTRTDCMKEIFEKRTRRRGTKSGTMSKKLRETSRWLSKIGSMLLESTKYLAWGSKRRLKEDLTSSIMVNWKGLPLLSRCTRSARVGPLRLGIRHCTMPMQTNKFKSSSRSWKKRNTTRSSRYKELMLILERLSSISSRNLKKKIRWRLLNSIEEANAWLDISLSLFLKSRVKVVKSLSMLNRLSILADLAL